VKSTFTGRALFEGYPGLLHGGVTAALLDGAMTNCLFARGIEALTAELKVRYREPIAVENEVTTLAWLAETYGRLHLLRGELRQDGRIKALAQGKFIESHE
jgi:acyl-coenzyme A thioesterase PaaI-like protein